RKIKPSDNDFVNFLTTGEGYHNFHHVFPWDYRSSEKGNNRFNYTTFFIDICAKFGQAYDLKYPSENLIKSIVLNKGDGTHSILSEVPMPEPD
ncbi:Acyl-CoA Delta(11) desaturase, partial [Trachymyrmex cornetzi]